MAFADKREIYLTKNNTCWSRFFVCKELSQVLIYADDNATSSAENIRALFSNLINGVDSSDLQYQADIVTYFVAIEFLIPSNIVKQLLSLKDKGFSNNDIAKKMLVPEQIIDFRLSSDGQSLFSD